MPAPLLLDLSHTCHTRARTGIQRVARALHNALGGKALAITHDPHRRAWRELERWELANLEAAEPSAKRGAHWPLAAKLRGRFAQWREHAGPALPENSGLLIPEVFSREVAAALPSLFGAVRGPRVAVFHDAIALQFPELSPAKTVARFPGYLHELLEFDGIAANSATSRDALRDFWQWAGCKNPPPIEAILLGVDAPASVVSSQRSAISDQLPTVLCVGTLEGRKNHLALLEACESLWARGEKFELRMVGSVNRETGAAAFARLRALQVQGRALRYEGALGEAAVAAAYADCSFTVYPSIVEGFGLPVIESLAHGKPCICSARGALGESARAGGCVALEAVDAPSLAGAIASLLASPENISALAAAARARKFRTWADYAAELSAWSRGLKRRN
jgi:glycosyltransferase involved in cell wall biosynthesis